jgi:hypothetical protein
MKARLLATVALLVATAVPIHAQETVSVDSGTESKPSDLPVNAPSGAVVKSLGGFYMWGKGGAWDAMQQKPSDPNAENAANSPASQKTQTPEMPLPAASSASTRGAVGYILPNGTLSPQFGSNVRTEFGLSQTTINTPLSNGAGPTVYNGVALGGCSTCGGMSGYDANEVSAKAATDYKFDTLTLTPSVTVFNSQSQQNFNGAAASSLGWRDTGAKVGFDSKLDLSKEVAIGIDGSYGRASRSVSLSTVSVGGSESTSPNFANGEAKITYKPSEELSLNGFAGVSNYGKVPLVESGGKVDYAPANNTYYGAGATWHFGTK